LWYTNRAGNGGLPLQNRLYRPLLKALHLSLMHMGYSVFSPLRVGARGYARRPGDSFQVTWAGKAAAVAVGVPA